jgi:hypothetical protein
MTYLCSSGCPSVLELSRRGRTWFLPFLLLPGERVLSTIASGQPKGYNKSKPRPRDVKARSRWMRPTTPSSSFRPISPKIGFYPMWAALPSSQIIV